VKLSCSAFNRKNINHLSKQQFFTQYKIIKHTKNLTPDCLLENDNKIDFKENIIKDNKNNINANVLFLF
jgi:hypothetical protein